MSLRRTRGDATFVAISTVPAALLVLLLVVPVAGLLVAGLAPGLRALTTDAELRASLLLTAWTASLATLVAAVCGTPLAWLMTRRRIPGRSLLAALLDLPLVIPHPVVGIAILLVLGRDTSLGSALERLGVRVVSTPFGIVAAMTFIAAPLFVSGAREAFDRVDVRLEHVARTLGDSPWRAMRRVTLPLAGRGLLAAAVVTWARAVSEFGAIVVLVYNPRVASVLAYDRLTTGGLPDALPVAAALIALSLIPLLALRLLNAPRERLHA